MRPLTRYLAYRNARSTAPHSAALKLMARLGAPIVSWTTSRAQGPQLPSNFSGPSPSQPRPAQPRPWLAMSSSNALEHACVGAPARKLPCAPSVTDLALGEILPGIKMLYDTSNQLRGRFAAYREPARPSCSSVYLSSSDERISSCMGAPARGHLCAPCPRVDLISDTSFSGHRVRFCARKLPLSLLALAFSPRPGRAATRQKHRPLPRSCGDARGAS